MPGQFWHFALVLACSVEFLIVALPELSSLTKKIAPPPSRAWQSRMTVPSTRSVIWSPSIYIAPPLPPPGLPVGAGFAPWPIALSLTIRLLSTVHETPMLLSALPLEHRPPRNVSLVM